MVCCSLAMVVSSCTSTMHGRLDSNSPVKDDDFALVPPQIDGPGNTQRAILEGGDITLVCGNSAIGNPTPTISWTDNNGITVSDGPEISGSDTLMLTITSVTRNHRGIWICNAENSVGNIQRQIVLDVGGKRMYNVVSHWQSQGRQCRPVTISIIVCVCVCVWGGGGMLVSTRNLACQALPSFSSLAVTKN